MRIGMIAPISWRVPPRGYGPWERVVSLLTEGLVERGLDVTLFATADSLTRAKLAAVCPHPYSEDASLDPKVWESIPEVIKHQQTGFIVDNLAEAVAAVQAVDQLDRAFIRRHIAQNFSCDQMVEGYIRVYQDILEQHQTTLQN